MRILSPGFIAAFADRILNIHPSLLPLYRGLHTHRRALEAGDSLHGCSVHFVTEELDGGPLVIQSQVKVLPGDSESSLSARVQQQEYRIYSQAIEWFARRRLQLREQRAWLDGRPLDAPVIPHRGRLTRYRMRRLGSVDHVFNRDTAVRNRGEVRRHSSQTLHRDL